MLPSKVTIRRSFSEGIFSRIPEIEITFVQVLKCTRLSRDDLVEKVLINGSVVVAVK